LELNIPRNQIVLPCSQTWSWIFIVPIWKYLVLQSPRCIVSYFYSRILLFHFANFIFPIWERGGANYSISGNIGKNKDLSFPKRGNTNYLFNQQILFKKFQILKNKLQLALYISNWIRLNLHQCLVWIRIRNWGKRSITYRDTVKSGNFDNEI
jgi:hypothetical protein